jgi:hypothetical protein
MVEDLINALRRIAKVSYGATIEEARSVSKTQREAADLLEQQSAHLTALESERDALLAAAGKEAVKITEPAQVAGSVFRAGISCDTVIKAAQRNYKYRNDPAVQDYPDRFTLAQIQAMDSIVPQGDREFVSLKDYQAAALEKGDGRDAERLDWLDENMFHREMNEWDARIHGGESMWVTFAPKEVQGSARKIIDAALSQKAGEQQ